jgi:hypothetical protein
LKFFIDNQTVYYEQGGALYHTQMDSYQIFDTDDGTPVRESTEQLERIHLLVTQRKLAQGVEHLMLF